MRERTTIPLPNFTLEDRLAIAPDNRSIAAAFTAPDGKPAHILMVWPLPAAGGPVGEGKLVARRKKTPPNEGMARFAFSADGRALLWSRKRDRHLTITDVSGTGKDSRLAVCGRPPRGRAGRPIPRQPL